jgi:hypothetical protein
MPVAILIPTYKRPHRIAAVTENALESTEHANVYFICEPDDKETIDTVTFTIGANLIINNRSRTYAGAINTAVLQVEEPHLFAGADDLNFHRGWYEIASDKMALPIKVVGTNDLYNPDVLAGAHATHYLVQAEYAKRGCVDQTGVMLSEAYHHNYTDTEFIATAHARGVYAPCRESIVEHNHWVWGRAQMDETYAKGRDTEHLDRAKFAERKHLWK